jgi:hypothetical protein
VSPTEVHLEAVVLDDVAREGVLHPGIVDAVPKPDVAHGHSRDPEAVLLPALPGAELERVERKVREVGEPATWESQMANLGREHLERAEREVVGVHVRDEHGVDRGHVRDVDPGLDQPARETGDRRREDRIGEHDLVVDLEEAGGVPHPEHREPRIFP